MRIYYYTAEDKYGKLEGRATISRKLRAFLEQQGYEFVDHPKKADIMHFHSSGIADSYIAWKLKNRFRIPCIFSFYSNSKTGIFSHFKNCIIDSLMIRKHYSNPFLSYTAIIPLKIRGIFLKKLDKVLVPTEILKNKLFKNTEVVHLGINVDKFKPEKIKNNPKLKIGYIGSPSIRRGFFKYVKATKILNDKFETHMCLSAIPKKVEKYILKNNPSMKILGLIDNVNEFYNEMDIMILPYNSYLAAVANPLILLEAMATGKAVVTTNLDFIKEIVRDCAITLNRCSKKNIINSVLKLAKDDNLRLELGKRARDIVVKEYNEEIMFRDYLRIYKEFEKKVSI